MTAASIVPLILQGPADLIRDVRHLSGGIAAPLDLLYPSPINGGT